MDCSRTWWDGWQGRQAAGARWRDACKHMLCSWGACSLLLPARTCVGSTSVSGPSAEYQVTCAAAAATAAVGRRQTLLHARTAAASCTCSHASACTFPRARRRTHLLSLVWAARAVAVAVLDWLQRRHAGVGRRQAVHTRQPRRRCCCSRRRRRPCWRWRCCRDGCCSHGVDGGITRAAGGSRGAAAGSSRRAARAAAAACAALWGGCAGVRHACVAAGSAAASVGAPADAGPILPRAVAPAARVRRNWLPSCGRLGTRVQGLPGRSELHIDVLKLPYLTFSRSSELRWRLRRRLYARARSGGGSLQTAPAGLRAVPGSRGAFVNSNAALIFESSVLGSQPAAVCHNRLRWRP